MGQLFDDTEPENDPPAGAIDDVGDAETFRIYIREGLDELQDWLREHPNG